MARKITDPGQMVFQAFVRELDFQHIPRGEGAGLIVCGQRDRFRRQIPQRPRVRFAVDIDDRDGNGFREHQPARQRTQEHQTEKQHPAECQKVILLRQSWF